MSYEARYYQKEVANKVKCLLCPHNCLIGNHKAGICLARQNEEGVLYALTYGELTSYAVDPVEKKPLYNFYPGTKVFSIGSWGCNLKCTFCQNWQTSQQKSVTEHYEKEEIITLAKESNSIGIAYTYNEPLIGYEFVFDVCCLAHENNLKNVLVTNGFINEEPLTEILPYIDAMNIDLKAFSNEFYVKVCAGQLAPVLKTIKQAKAAGIHVELTTLIIPGLNDEKDIESIVEWVSEISVDIPLHFSRYFPQYKMSIEQTELKVLQRAYEIGKRKLKYVYMGNVPAQVGGSDTYCPKCGEKIIKRDFIDIDSSKISDGKCIYCNQKIAGCF
ncbi:MAG: AmmeMemoRadiSam system radical SAM enzyme [bacterium]